MKTLSQIAVLVACFVFSGLVTLGFGVEAEEKGAASAAEENASASKGAPTIELEKLLKLPDGLQYQTHRKGGATRSEWQQRFANANSELQAAKQTLAEVQEELELTVGPSDAWQLAPPGMEASNRESTVNYRLRQAMRRSKEEVARTERQLRDLEIEANLASVPASWRNQ